MLQVEQLDVFYGDIQVLWDISFHVHNNEFVVLVGSNGAGKSTLMKTISGLVRPKRGSIRFGDVRLDQLKPYEIIKFGLSHIPEGRQLFPEMSVLENLEMGALNPEAKAKRKETLEWVFSLFPRLKERTGQMAGTLSGGEQQMCAIARGLMSLPRMVLLDEPSLGLSPRLTQEIFRLVQEIHHKGMTILMVEQNVKQTLAICDRGYVLENGRIVLEGRGQDLLEDQRVKEAFLGL
ncbi:ABC transporter ATP-binding protein [Desulfoglaeba alkanexedens]|jgi:branched-chain amino acid transport system ATP-binding protein|uniref:ABC transporter ATP-binding protein n=1 Tax=Desulfoglaeba alkanexedens ALDC TaxID=980445 RepID=A0A4P8L5Y7_9BACT|nr:ABC transporter ATP-binding protein [Desulfoglaeba alkanexedens]QCQ23163.1 ABC transporter ATP-binding protein [Desulfoglaeba alkanexedens ALDC]